MAKKIARLLVSYGAVYLSWIPFARPVGKLLFGGLFNKPVLKIHLPRPADRGRPPEWSPPEASTARTRSALGPRPDSFVLYRIIGNDLEPRHKKGQALENLRFILENEPELQNCEKRFMVNRIVDPEQERLIVDLLNASGVSFQRIAFNWNEYAHAPWDIDGVPPEFAPYTKAFRSLTVEQQYRVLMRVYRHKNNYVMNNNGARNAALADGRKLARWILPWDGNCFVTASAWDAIRDATLSAPEYPYRIVPMARVMDNTDLLRPDFNPDAEEEPQILFRNDAKEVFDGDFFYGRRPKVELLWRLGVPGRWDNWYLEPWDLPYPPFSVDAGAFQHVGWVARLFSGRGELEQGAAEAYRARGVARNVAIETLLSRLDDEVQRKSRGEKLNTFVPCSYDGRTPATREKELPAKLAETLRATADGAMKRGPFSVIDKTTLPPSGNKHDYWHPAPYYWPHPLRLAFLPYVHRDGLRVPGTVLYEPLSSQFDRTSLQRLFDDTYTLVLGYLQFGIDAYAQHARRLVTRWFVERETAMTPHLSFAQVRRGHDGNRGDRSGVIEMKDMYFFLDAVRVLIHEQVLSPFEVSAFADWLEQYLHWLLESEQGRGERAANNNHGTYFDLQVVAISSFLGKTRILRDTLRDSRFRLATQFHRDGAQPEELRRTLSAHYCCFNLQGWVHLAELGMQCGEDLWDHRGPEGQGIEVGLRWLMHYVDRPWPFEQIAEFDKERFVPLAYALDRHYEDGFALQKRVPGLADTKPIFHPHDGIHPFWQLKYLAARSGSNCDNIGSPSAAPVY